jgi:hypothetical protein
MHYPHDEVMLYPPQWTSFDGELWRQRYLDSTHADRVLCSDPIRRKRACPSALQLRDGD